MSPQEQMSALYRIHQDIHNVMQDFVSKDEEGAVCTVNPEFQELHIASMAIGLTLDRLRAKLGYK